MLRVLLAAEGRVDEVVLEAICSHFCHIAAGNFTKKAFPARGIAQVFRLLPDVIRAAHFGYFQLLVVHADMDDSPDHLADHVEPDCRTCKLLNLVRSATANLPTREGLPPLEVVLALPKQSTDAWLLWGTTAISGVIVEARHRHDVKEDVFGPAPFGHTGKAQDLVQALLARLGTTAPPPPALCSFRDRLLLATCASIAAVP